MATALEECTAEEQRSVMRFCGRNDSIQLIFVKKRFLFSVESIFRIKRFTIAPRNCLKVVRNSQTMPDQVALLRLRQKQLCKRMED
jgi:hypothetical protein